MTNVSVGGGAVIAGCVVVVTALILEVLIVLGGDDGDGDDLVACTRRRRSRNSLAKRQNSAYGSSLASPLGIVRESLPPPREPLLPHGKHSGWSGCHNAGMWVRTTHAVRKRLTTYKIKIEHNNNDSGATPLLNVPFRVKIHETVRGG